MNHFIRLALASIVIATSLQGQPASKPTAKPAADGDRNPFQEFQSFSATLNGGMANDHNRKIYRSGKKMRLDFDEQYRLVDLEKLNTRVIHSGSCHQFPNPDAATYPFSAYYDFKVMREPTSDKETVDGHSCKIENVTFTPRDDRPVVIKMKLWEAEDLQGFPVKVEVNVVAKGSKFTLNYSNVSLKPPDPALFKSPAKCEITKESDLKKMQPAKPADNTPTVPLRPPD